MPVFERLQPLAAELNLPADWRDARRAGRRRRPAARPGQSGSVSLAAHAGHELDA